MEAQRRQETLEFRWTDKQQVATDTADVYRFTLYGGARGPGKSYWLRWYLLRFILLSAEAGFPGMRAGLFCEDYPTLKDRQISKISTEFPSWLGELKESRTDGLGFHLRNGLGVLVLRNLDDASKYQSSEFGAIGVDELTKNKLETFNLLRGSLRWPGMANVRFVAGSNPGGIGHLWVKAYFIDHEYPPELQPLANEFAYVPALPNDNPYLDPTYWQMLDTLPHDLARAWRWADWTVFAGQVFSVFKEEMHVIAPCVLPDHWLRWRAVDWGFRAPFCCLWFAQDPDTGRVYVYRELYATDLTDRDQARQIKDATPKAEKIRYTLADPSMWTKKTHEDKTFSTADEYRAEGVLLTPADNDRMTGKRKVSDLLQPMADGIPGLLVLEACVNLRRTLPALPYDPVNVEDVDTSAEDHPYDTLRYGLTRVNPRPKPKISLPPPPPDPIMKHIRSPATGSRDL